MKPQVDTDTRQIVKRLLEQILTEASTLFNEAILVPRVTEAEYKVFLSEAGRLKLDKEIKAKLINILAEYDLDEEEFADAKYRRSLQRAIQHFEGKEIASSLRLVQKEWNKREELITSSKFAMLEQKMPAEVREILKQPDEEEVRRMEEGQLWRITNAISFVKKQEDIPKQTITEVIEFLEASKQEFMNNPDRIRLYPDSVLSKTKTMWATNARQIRLLVTTPRSARDAVLQMIPMLLPDINATPDTIMCGVNDILTMLKQNSNEEIDNVSGILVQLALAKENDNKEAWVNLWSRLTIPLRKKLKDNQIVWDTDKDTLIRHMNSVDVLGLFETVNPDDLAARWSLMSETTKKEICGTIDVRSLTSLSHKGYLQVVCQAWPWIPEPVKVQYLDNLSHPKGKSVVPIQLLPIHRKYLVEWIELSAESKGKRADTVDEASRIFNQRLQQTNQQVEEFDLLEWYDWFTARAMQMYRHADLMKNTEETEETRQVVLQIIRHKDTGASFPLVFLQRVPTKYRMHLREYEEGTIEEKKTARVGWSAITGVQTEVRERLRILDTWLSAWDQDTEAKQDLPPIAAAASLIDAWLDALEEVRDASPTNSIVDTMVTFGTFDDIPEDILQQLNPEYRVTFDPDNPLFQSNSPLQTRIREAREHFDEIVQGRPLPEEEDVPMDETVEEIFTQELTLNAADVRAVLHLLQKDETEQLEMKKPVNERKKKLLKRTISEAEWLSYLLLRDPLVRQRWNIKMLNDQLDALSALPQSPRNNVLVSLVHELREALNTPWSALRRGEWNKYCKFSPEEKKSDDRTIKFPVVTSKDNVDEIEQWTQLCDQYRESRTTSKPELDIVLHSVDKTSIISLMEIATAPLDNPVAWARNFSLFVSDLIEENKAFREEVRKWLPWTPDHYRAKWKQSLKKHALERTDETAEKLLVDRNRDKISSEEYALLSDQLRFYHLMTNRQEFLKMPKEEEGVIWSTRRRMENMVIDDEDTEDYKQTPEWIKWNQLFVKYYGLDLTKPLGKPKAAVYEQWKNNAPRILIELELAACLDCIDSQCVQIYQYRDQALLRKTGNWILDQAFEPALDRVQQYLDVSSLDPEDLPAHLQPWMEKYPTLTPIQLFDKIVESKDDILKDKEEDVLFWQLFDKDLEPFRRTIGLCTNRVLASENGCKAKSRTVQQWAFRVYRKSELPIETFLDMLWVPTNDSEIQQWCMDMATFINKSEYRKETLCEWHHLPVPKACRDVIRETRMPRVFGVLVGLDYLLEAMSNFDTQRALNQLDMLSNKDLGEFAKGSYYPRYKNHFLRCGIFNYLYNPESLKRVTEEKKVNIVYKLSLEEANDVFQHYDELPYEALWYAYRYCKEQQKVVIPKPPNPDTGRHYLMRVCIEYGTLREHDKILRIVFGIGSHTFGVRRPSAAIQDIVKPFVYVEGTEDEETRRITEQLKKVGSLSSWISQPFYQLDGRMYVQAVTTRVPAIYAQDE